jgi:hypothetical protein
MKADRVALTLAVVFVLAAGIVLAERAGYSPDEEITWFVVKGIDATFLPRLPSGLDYWRGPLYSYSLWLAASTFGFSFVTYRLFSVVLSIGALACTYAVARRISTATTATGVLMLALMPAFVTNSAYARFYAALIAASAAALALVLTKRPIFAFVVAASAARLSHELGAAVSLFPLAAWLGGCELHPSFRKRSNIVMAVGFLLALHFGLAGLQRTGIGGEAAAAEGAWLGMPVPALGMWPVVQIAHWQDWGLLSILAAGTCVRLRRGADAVDMLFVVALAAAAIAFSVGAILAISMAWLLSAPERARRSLAIGLTFAAASWLLWTGIIALRSDMFLSAKASLDLVAASIRANMDGFEFVMREMPIAAAFIGIAVAASIVNKRTEGNQVVRALALIFLGQVAAFGIFGTDPRTRFIAVASPFIAVLAAAGVWALRSSRWRQSFVQQAVWGVFSILATLAIIVEQREFVVSMTDRATTAIRAPWSAWFPPVGLEHPFDFELSPQTDGRIFSNDELAAVLILGRSDYWIAPDDFAARFYGRRVESGQLHGIYAGSSVVASEGELRTLVGAGDSATLVWFHSGKFGGAPPSFADPMAWPPGSMFQSTSDWSVIRVPRH